jgi:hypothetical protein
MQRTVFLCSNVMYFDRNLSFGGVYSLHFHGRILIQARTQKNLVVILLGSTPASAAFLFLQLWPIWLLQAINISICIREVFGSNLGHGHRQLFFVVFSVAGQIPG